MDILKITGAKSLWHYFKFMCSACYRKQLQVEKAREQQTLNELIQKDKLLEETSLISKADAKGRITYANDKFLKVAGYTLEECIGKDHNIVNSGHHPKEVWQDMYNTVVKEKKIWHHECPYSSKKNSLKHTHYI